MDNRTFLKLKQQINEIKSGNTTDDLIELLLLRLRDYTVNTELKELAHFMPPF